MYEIPNKKNISKSELYICYCTLTNTNSHQRLSYTMALQNHHSVYFTIQTDIHLVLKTSKYAREKCTISSEMVFISNICSVKMAILIYIFGYQYRHTCPKTVLTVSIHNVPTKKYLLGPRPSVMKPP